MEIEVPASAVSSSNRLSGRRILVVGGSGDAWGERRNDCVTRAAELGVDVILLGAEKSPAAAVAQTVIPADTADEMACHQAVERYLESASLDGIITFLEELTELTARLQRAFGFKGHSIAGTRACREKNLMRETLEDNNLPVPAFAHLNTRCDAERVADWFPTPAFLKPAEGGGSVGTRRVTNNGDIVPAFDDVVREIDTVIPSEIVESLLVSFSEDHANLLLEEYLAPAKRLERHGLGRVGVELLVQDGEVFFFAMADGQCFSSSDHRYSTLCFPSRLGQDDQRQFRSLADDIVKVFGLSDGPVILDAVMTECGPQLYEINARIDGSIVLPLIQICYGVDMVEQSLRIAANLSVDPAPAEEARASALLHFFLSPSPSRISRLAFPHGLPFEKDCTLTQLKHEGDFVGGPEATYDAMATLTLTGGDRDELDARYAEYMSEVKIDLEEVTGRSSTQPPE